MSLPSFPFPGESRGIPQGKLDISMRDEGEPNFFSIMAGRHWVCQIQMNGEFTVSQQIAMVSAMRAAIESENMIDKMWPKP